MGKNAEKSKKIFEISPYPLTATHKNYIIIDNRFTKRDFPKTKDSLYGGSYVMNRVYNFSAGPSMLPLEVLEKAASELVCYCES